MSWFESLFNMFLALVFSLLMGLTPLQGVLLLLGGYAIIMLKEIGVF